MIRVIGDRKIIFRWSFHYTLWLLLSLASPLPHFYGRIHTYDPQVVYGHCNIRNYTCTIFPAAPPFCYNQSISSYPSAPSLQAIDSTITSSQAPTFQQCWRELKFMLATWQLILPFWFRLFFFIEIKILVAGGAEASEGLRSVE